ncbi:triosephosphate isomerase [Datura stramonium]|uniref:Triosephosphate isomerase n=1 Tax=Datura stramonium TaxID=4076 RepID=A0ABS8T574_DATST|nr:triosephosphate isomerase [Datura stramonium]
MEDAAEGCLNELIRRSLMQVENLRWEEVINCRIHDLLRDLAVQKALEKSYSLNNIGNLERHSTLILCCEMMNHSALEYLSSCPKAPQIVLTWKNRKTACLRPISKFHHNDGPLLFKTHGRSDAYSGNVAKPKESRISSSLQGKLPAVIASFSQLEFLRLDSLKKLKRWHLATSAMPLIKGLGIYDCPKLKEIPRMRRLGDVEEI